MQSDQGTLRSYGMSMSTLAVKVLPGPAIEESSLRHRGAAFWRSSAHVPCCSDDPHDHMHMSTAAGMGRAQHKH